MSDREEFEKKNRELNIINPNRSERENPNRLQKRGISDQIGMANNITDINKYKRKVQTTNRGIQEYNKGEKTIKTRNIKNKPSKTKWKTKLAIGLVAGLVAIGAIAAHQKGNEEQPQKPKTEQTTVIPNESEEEKIENEIKEIKQDFLERYLKSYNEKYNMDYKASDAEICANYLNAGYVYKVNGNLVTPGKNPDITKDKLSKIGDVEIEYGHDRIIQIIVHVNEDELKVLGTYDKDTLVSMYSGIQLEDLGNKVLDNKVLELEEVVGISKEMGKTMGGIVFGEGNETLNSLQDRMKKYKEAAEVRDENRTSIEKEDDDMVR